MKDKLKGFIINKQYKEAVEILKKIIKEYIIIELKKQNSEFNYTNIFDLDKECQMYFKDRNIVKKVFYDYDDIYMDDEEKIESLMDIYEELIKM